jgi:large subunit ribosomal protein L6
MSRIGKQPVVVLKGVEVKLADRNLSVKGPKGTLTQWIDPRITVAVDAAGGKVNFTRTSDDPQVRALHGLYRALCRNMVEGVTTGYAKRLEIHGVGFQCKVEKGQLNLQIGYSMPVLLTIPKGITVETPNPTTVDIKGFDRQLVGSFAAQIRTTRPPEPYKGKGIRYAGEQIRRMAGKSMATGK